MTGYRAGDTGRRPLDDGAGRSRPDAPPERPGTGTDPLDPTGLVARLAAAGTDPPVGLVLVGWEPPDEEATEYRHQTERSVAFVAAATTDAGDTVTAASTDRVAIIKAPLRAPAAAEGLAHRVARALDVELDRLSTASDRAAVPWAIGVAVDRPEDRPDQLLRHAEAALDDAWLQGGRRVVAFDDEDRDLADPTG